jgi:dTDP-4-amino-4,6-dideoxygalactose transaminase
VEPVWHLYVIRTARRDALLAHLQGRGIGALIHYPVPIHLQAAYQDRSPRAEGRGRRAVFFQVSGFIPQPSGSRRSEGGGLKAEAADRGTGWQAGQFPVSERLAAEILSLPIYPEMTEEKVERVIREVREFF